MARVGSRIRPKTKEKFKNAIQSVIDGLSRSVLVYKQPLKSECTNCFYDKMTDSSTGKCKWSPVEALQKQKEWEDLGFSTIRYKYFVKGRCPVCKGKGYLETVRKAWINCLVTWNPSSRDYIGEITYTPAGTEGSSVVMLKTNPKHLDLFKNADKIVVDDVECKISRLPFLRGLGNESVLIVMAFTTEKPKVDSEEILKEYR